MSQPKPRLARIMLKHIRQNPVALRTVNKEAEEYKGLVDSIKTRGVLNPILVREINEQNEAGEQLYGLIDGLHRYNGSLDCGADDIPAQVYNMSDGDVLEAQVIGNIHKFETKPVEYSRQLSRIIAQNPLMTAAELAGRLNRSTTWVGERLGLVKLKEEYANFVDESKITLTNAFALAKLPLELQESFIDRAMTQSPGEFVPAAQKALKEYRDTIRQGKTPNPNAFIAVEHLQNKLAIMEEIKDPKIGPALISRHLVTSPMDAFRMGLLWSLHMDPESIEEQRLKHEQRLAERKTAKEQAKSQRDAKKQTEAAQVVASVG